MPGRDVVGPAVHFEPALGPAGLRVAADVFGQASAATGELGQFLVGRHVGLLELHFPAHAEVVLGQLPVDGLHALDNPVGQRAHCYLISAGPQFA